MEPVDTEWGTYGKHSPVRIIDRTDDTYLISFDLGDHPAARNHHAMVARAVVDAWPEGIEHGTPEGIAVHRRRHERICRACNAVNYRSELAGRITHGKPTINTPVELVAELYLNAPVDLQRRAADVLHPDVIDAAVYRYDTQETA
ncbi:hypothetical protein [Prescottella equi]|uniref:hypothetical protein n=1 Tax=Rhodococcus hoagii TaxID=43767 RepID=UPI001EECA696|nr:hypothetical protein [Prescottella equi]